ncbi:MAG: hypothetical protein J1F11_11120 [Oscillospiraceae bacterium]|nr:hypothetical protein [Oscillospiraceae bacterium]
MDVKTIQMRCKVCDGVMTVDENNTIMMCPYCGSKELIQESDNVIIERIKSETNKDIESKRLEYEERKEKRQEEKELSQKFKSGKLIKVIIVAFIVSLIALVISFRQGMILAGLVALVQAVLLACALLMGLQIIKEKKPNLHIIATIIAFILIIPFFKARSSFEAPKPKYDWPSYGISTMLPKPDAKKGEIITNSDSSFYMHTYKVSEKQYEKYIKECQDSGFTVESEKDGSRYSAYNSDGYKLSLSYYKSNDELTINLDAPKDMSKFKWPDSDIAKLLPIPKSDVGHIEWERSDGFLIYVGETTKEDFSSYVDACKEKGFTVDYRLGDDYYYGDNNDGYSLSLKYEGNKTMYIRIDAPDEEEEVESDENIQRNNIVGTYVGVQGSVIVLFEDGTGTYYWDGDNLIDEKCSWTYGNGKITIKIPSLYCEVQADYYGTNTSINFVSDSKNWDDELYDKINSSAEKMSTDEYNKLIDEYGKHSDGFQNNSDNRTETTKKETPVSADGVTPELKAFLDEYEAFWDDYVEFYKSYMESLSSGDYFSMLGSYTDMLEEMEKYDKRLDEMEKKLDQIDEDELSAEDYAYYLEVTTRIYLKMLEMYQ